MQSSLEMRIDEILSRLTLKEKIGQLTLPVTGEITTGQAKSSDIAGKIRKDSKTASAAAAWAR